VVRRGGFLAVAGLGQPQLAGRVTGELVQCGRYLIGH
jgi:hypothetical protein